MKSMFRDYGREAQVALDTESLSGCGTSRSVAHKRALFSDTCMHHIIKTFPAWEHRTLISILLDMSLLNVPFIRFLHVLSSPFFLRLKHLRLLPRSVSSEITRTPSARWSGIFWPNG